MKEQKFNISDTVLVTGSTMSADNSIKIHRIIATVVAVGKYDLFLEHHSQNYSSRNLFKVSKKRCYNINYDYYDLDSEPILPKLGDLVVSIEDTYTKGKRKIVGILISIIDKPGSSKTAKVKSGEKVEVVSYDSLLLIEIENIPKNNKGPVTQFI